MRKDDLDTDPTELATWEHPLDQLDDYCFEILHQAFDCFYEEEIESYLDVEDESSLREIVQAVMERAGRLDLIPLFSWGDDNSYQYGTEYLCWEDSRKEGVVCGKCGGDDALVRYGAIHKLSADAIFELLLENVFLIGDEDMTSIILYPPGFYVYRKDLVPRSLLTPVIERAYQNTTSDFMPEGYPSAASWLDSVYT